MESSLLTTCGSLNIKLTFHKQISTRRKLTFIRSAIVNKCGELYKSCSLQRPSDVHLTPAGIDFTAAEAAKDILNALGLQQSQSSFAS